MHRTLGGRFAELEGEDAPGKIEDVFVGLFLDIVDARRVEGNLQDPAEDVVRLAGSSRNKTATEYLRNWQAARW